jgi:hypothetical protein|tara:strand:+ start:1329 stop:1709 length:381 start_codon:yes stop_codon:yes gene_type:complete
MKSKKNSNKSFGFLFFLVFLTIGLWPLMSSESIRIWSIILSVIFLTLGIINSKILNPFKKGWIKLGELLGRIIAPVVMFAIFFLIVTPIGLLMKLLGKDIINLKFNKKIKSYWVPRKAIKSMKRQF